MKFVKLLARNIGQWLNRTERQSGAWESNHRWLNISEKEMAQITGRTEPMSRAEAVLRLRLQEFEGFPHGPYPDRTRTDLYRFIGPMRVEVFIPDDGMHLRWFPSMLPGCEPIWAVFAIEDWVEEQECLDDLAAIAACDSDLPRSLAGLNVEGVPIALGIAALDAFFQVIPRIDLYGPDLKEIVTQYAVEEAMTVATKNAEVTT